ncbi:DNA-directed RNA polymerase [Candidatus Woesearchaeota archaeon]|nr:DNA-directed RNA polymerase [Candidatus Woesearchaeota archaeon]
MFYKIEAKDRIRVTPDLFGEKLNLAVAKMIKSKYEGFVSQELGIVIDVIDVKNIGEGLILPGDGSSFYETTFELLTYKPEMQEVIFGKVKDIAEFGVFLSIGPLEGMIHISQSMDDFVSFSKDKVLIGRDTKRTLKVGDVCKARIIAVSFKDAANPKIGLTMRQPGLGKIEWFEEDLKPKESKKEKEKPAKEGKKGKK